MSEVAQADPAQLEAAEHGPGPAAAVATGVRAHAVLLLAALLHAERRLGHYESLLSVANGIPSARRRARPCSSVCAVVVIAMSRPRIAGTES